MKFCIIDGTGDTELLVEPKKESDSYKKAMKMVNEAFGQGSKILAGDTTKDEGMVRLDTPAQVEEMITTGIAKDANGKAVEAPEAFVVPQFQGG